ncbi:MAG: hypothetical protein WC657_09410, partial [Candidatus Paceibacterota bacterium]
MINFILSKILGTQNERVLKGMVPVIAAVNSFEPALSALSDEALKAKTKELRSVIGSRLKEEGFDDASDEDKKRIDQLVFEEVLPEAFA